MQTIDAPSAKTLKPDFEVGAASLSAGWLIRRSALWLLFVGLGIGGSCLLYMAASKAEADSMSRSADRRPLQ
jgi:hypothetical protein